jgi:large subunit ribosomal protein L2
MQIQKVKPVTPGIRHKITIKKNLLSKNNSIIKNLMAYYHRKNGHGSDGHITVWHKQRGHKKLYRLINFGNFPGRFLVISNFYDPYRSAFISLVFNFIYKKFDFLLLTENMNPGTLFLSELKHMSLDLRLGDKTRLKYMPGGLFIHSIIVNAYKRASYVRSAGTFGQIIQKSRSFFKIRLPSGKIITLNNLVTATVGRLSNFKHNLSVIGKAGRNRNLGRRPIVRGVAMNPVDHPHGGRTKGGCHWVTPWGKPTKGKKTVK